MAVIDTTHPALRGIPNGSRVVQVACFDLVVGIVFGPTSATSPIVYYVEVRSLPRRPKGVTHKGMQDITWQGGHFP